MYVYTYHVCNYIYIMCVYHVCNYIHVITCVCTHKNSMGSMGFDC